MGTVPVNSPTRITPENNGKIRPEPDRENGFARASGGGKGTGVEPSLGFECRTVQLAAPEPPLQDYCLEKANIRRKPTW